VTISVTYSFHNAAVLITGAGSGIGAAFARHCARADATVIAVDVSHTMLLRDLESAARSRIDVREIDVSDREAVFRLVEDVRNAHPRLDAAVLGAAIQGRTEIDVMSASEWQRTIDVNLGGVFNFLQAIIPVMKAQRGGSIVAFTSGLASTGWPGASAYAASKAALVGLIKSAAHELKSHHVRINLVSPGLRATPIFLDVSSQEEQQYYAASIGIGEPEGVVPTLLYLASDASANLTGAVIEQRILAASESKIGDIGTGLA
jgi:NAD(P)-dependent dehydrogenase (short-subunit alcohol dehydrogenase family)